MLLMVLQTVKGNKDFNKILEKHNYGSLMGFIVTVTACKSTDKWSSLQVLF